MRRPLVLCVVCLLALAVAATSTTAAASAKRPDISGKTLNGQNLKLKWYRGKWVFINVWASWCGPCNAEAAAYARFVRSQPSARFIGLNVADTVSRGKAFVRKYRWKWPSIVDPNRTLEAKLGAVYQPVVVLVSPKGEIAGIHVGPGDARDWRALLARARR